VKRVTRNACFGERACEGPLVLLLLRYRHSRTLRTIIATRSFSQRELAFMISILFDIFTLLCSLVSSFPYSSLSYLSLRATHAMPPVLHHHPLSCLIVHCMSWSISHLTPTSPCFCIKVACQTALAFGTRPWPSEIKLSLNFFLRHAPSQSASRS
jgi:hypothetical protein